MKKEGFDMKREEYISDETVIKRANAAVKIELEKNKALGIYRDATDISHDMREKYGL